MNEPQYHIPALLPEVIDALNVCRDGVYVDATFGGGGHTRGIMEKLGSEGHIYSFDQDQDAVERAFADERFTIVHGNFRYLRNFLRYYGVEQVDGILADLGVSFHHFDDSERGFSFRFSGPLDMRMNRKASMTAADLLSTYSEQKLGEIFTLYGELKQGRRLAAAIVKMRNEGQLITTVEQLREVAMRFISPKHEKKELAMVFQALRIEVNAEMQALQKFLEQTLTALRPGGRLAIITYHSLEDRLVKNFIKSGNIAGDVQKDFYGVVHSPLRAVNNKPIVPTDEEVERNPRSRSAKLRVAERV